MDPFYQQLHQTSTLRESTIEHKQGIQLCYAGCVWYQVTLYNSNNFEISTNVSEQSLKFWKFLTISFGWGCYDWKLLKIIMSHFLKSVN